MSNPSQTPHDGPAGPNRNAGEYKGAISLQPVRPTANRRRAGQTDEAIRICHRLAKKHERPAAKVAAVLIVLGEKHRTARDGTAFHPQ